MYTNPSFNVANVQLSVLPIEIVKIDGYFKGATADRWLQVWDTANVPTTLEGDATNIGACLLKEWPIPQSAPFYFEFKQNSLQTKFGCFVGLSTTEGSWTASTDDMDISIETTSAPYGTVAANVAGDLTNDVAALTVFNNGTGGAGDGPGRLYRVDFYDSNGATYLQLFAASPVSGVTVPLWISPITVAPHAIYRYDFGGAGLPLYVRSSAGVVSNACVLVGSSTSAVYTDTGSNYRFQAVFSLP